MITPIDSYHQHYYCRDDHPDGEQLVCLHCTWFPESVGRVWTLDDNTRDILSALSKGGSKFRRRYDDQGRTVEVSIS